MNAMKSYQRTMAIVKDGLKNSKNLPHECRRHRQTAKPRRRQMIEKPAKTGSVPFWRVLYFGAGEPSGIRTPDPLIKKSNALPSELMAQVVFKRRHFLTAPEHYIQTYLLSSKKSLPPRFGAVCLSGGDKHAALIFNKNIAFSYVLPYLFAGCGWLQKDR